MKNAELLAEIDRLRASEAALKQNIDAAWAEAIEQGAEIGIRPMPETSLDSMICAISDKYSERGEPLIHPGMTPERLELAHEYLSEFADNVSAPFVPEAKKLAEECAEWAAWMRERGDAFGTANESDAADDVSPEAKEK